MPLLNLEYFGEARGHQKIIPGDTATGIDAQLLTYYEYFLNVSGVDAGSTEPTAGQWIVGQTSAARANIISAVLNSGAYGNANARVTLRLRSMSGTWTATENLGIGANLNHFTVTNPTGFTRCEDGYAYCGMPAKVALIEVYTFTALLAWDGSTPDQTSLIGIPFGSLMSVVLRDPNSLRKFRCIDYTSGSASTIQVALYY